MARKRHTAEEIVAKLRQVDVLMAQGRQVADAVRAIGVTEVTYYRWRNERRRPTRSSCIPIFSRLSSAPSTRRMASPRKLGIARPRQSSVERRNVAGRDRPAGPSTRIWLATRVCDNLSAAYPSDDAIAQKQGEEHLDHALTSRNRDMPSAAPPKSPDVVHLWRGLVGSPPRLRISSGPDQFEEQSAGLSLREIPHFARLSSAVAFIITGRNSARLRCLIRRFPTRTRNPIPRRRMRSFPHAIRSASSPRRNRT